jgi:hypothetical protein
MEKQEKEGQKFLEKELKGKFLEKKFNENLRPFDMKLKWKKKRKGFFHIAQSLEQKERSPIFVEKHR